MTLKIALIGSAYYSSGGGIAAYNRAVAEILTSQGHDLLVISTDRKSIQEQTNYIYSQYYVPDTTAAEKVIAKAMFEEISSFNPDVIISSDHIWVNSLFPCFSDHRIKISVVHASLHESDQHIEKAALTNFPHVDWIVVLSHYARDSILRRYQTMDPSSIKVIYNTILATKYESCTSQSCLNRGEPINILYTGGGSERKGSDTILKLCHRLKQLDLKWNLFWLGNTKIIQTFLPEKYRHQVKLIGPVDHKHVNEYLNISDFILIPSRGEGCPMILLEALQKGVIPIVSDCPSAMREIIHNNVSGFVVPVGDAKISTSIIEKLSDSCVARKEISMNAISLFYNKLAPPVWLKNMEKLLYTKRQQHKTQRQDIFDSSILQPWHRRCENVHKINKYFLKKHIMLLRHALKCAYWGCRFRVK